MRLLLFILLLNFSLQAELHWTLGDIVAYGVKEDGITRNRSYLEVESQYRTSCDHTIEGSLRGWYDFANSDKELQVRSLYYHAVNDEWSLKLGVQEIPWGETFGFYIVDLVNPRDLTDPFFNELSWIRLPTFTLNLQYLGEKWNVQCVLTPVPRNNWFPEDDGPFDVFDPFRIAQPSHFHIRRLGKDSEYGVRVGYLFDSGWDLTAFAFRHWNRNPIYQFESNKGSLELDPVVRLINSYGLSFSKAFEQIVLRGDTVLHERQPFWPDTVGVVERRRVWKTILGMDQTFENDVTWGLQYHVDVWKEDFVHWASIQLIRDVCEGVWRCQIFVFKGINNQDLWIQPQIIWFPGEGWEVSLRGDIPNGKKRGFLPKEGLLGPFRRKDRMLMWLRRFF